VLPDHLDERIAQTIRNRLKHEREAADTGSPAWRERCEVATVAMLGDAERQLFLSHVATNRGDAVANGLQQSADQMRTAAIFILRGEVQ
jgi:phage baseplate assembly protein W